MSISKETVITAVGVAILLGVGAWIGYQVAESVNEKTAARKKEDEVPENAISEFGSSWNSVSYEDALCTSSEDGLNVDLYNDLLLATVEYIHTTNLTERHYRKHFSFLNEVENIEVRNRLKAIVGCAVNRIYIRHTTDVELKAVTLDDVIAVLAE